MSDKIQCSLCSVNCNQLNTHTIAIISQNGTHLCLPCSEIQDWTNSLSTTKKQLNKSTKSTKPVLIKNSQNILTCPKCKTQFSEAKCKCGFKNPLYK